MLGTRVQMGKENFRVKLMNMGFSHGGEAELLKKGNG